MAPAAVRRCLAVIRSEAFADAGPRAGIGVQFPDHPEIEGRRRNPNAVIVRKAQLNRSLAPRMTRKSASSRNNGKLAPTQSSGARQSPADGRGSLAWYSKSNPTAFQAVSFSSRAGRMEGWRSTHISAHATYNCKIPRHLAYEIFVQILRERIAERARDRFVRCASAGCGGHTTGSIAGSHPHAAIGTPAFRTIEAGAVHQRAVAATSAERIPRSFGNGICGPHLWARGEFLPGGVDEQLIKAYIESQKWDDDHQKFKITAPPEPLRRLCSRGILDGGFSRIPDSQAKRNQPTCSRFKIPAACQTAFRAPFPPK